MVIQGNTDMTVKEWLKTTKTKRFISSKTIEGAESRLRENETLFFACGGRLNGVDGVGILLITSDRVMYYQDNMLAYAFMELAFADILAVEIVGLYVNIKGLRITISFTSNSTLSYSQAIYDLIMPRLTSVDRDCQTSAPAPAGGDAPCISPADELLKWKQVLDAGAITQEEYDAKKKQLLGL